jgi:hypothetical protein
MSCGIRKERADKLTDYYDNSSINNYNLNHFWRANGLLLSLQFRDSKFFHFFSLKGLKL